MAYTRKVDDRLGAFLWNTSSILRSTELDVLDGDDLLVQKEWLDRVAQTWRIHYYPRSGEFELVFSEQQHALWYKVIFS